jgi:hypothetical protein
MLKPVSVLLDDMQMFVQTLQSQGLCPDDIAACVALENRPSCSLKRAGLRRCKREQLIHGLAEQLVEIDAEFCHPILNSRVGKASRPPQRVRRQHTYKGAPTRARRAPRVGAPRLVAAKSLFNSLGCRGCHKIGGVGGADGPDLTLAGDKDPARVAFTHVTGKHTIANWHVQHLRHPARIVPDSQMPDFGLADEQIDLLTGNVGKIGGNVGSYAGDYRVALFNGCPQYINENPFDIELDPAKPARPKQYWKAESAHFYNHEDHPLRVGNRLLTGQSHIPTPTKSLWFANANSILGNVKWHYNTVVVAKLLL